MRIKVVDLWTWSTTPLSEEGKGSLAQLLKCCPAIGHSGQAQITDAPGKAPNADPWAAQYLPERLFGQS